MRYKRPFADRRSEGNFHGKRRAVGGTAGVQSFFAELLISGLCVILRAAKNPLDLGDRVVLGFFAALRVTDFFGSWADASQRSGVVCGLRTTTTGANSQLNPKPLQRSPCWS